MSKKGPKRQRRKQSKKYGKEFYTVVVLFVIAVAVFAMFFIQKPLEVRIVQVKFEIGESPGIDLNKTVLSFGRVPPKSKTYRNIDFENGYDFPVNVTIYASKEISEFISVSPSFEIDAHNKTMVPFELVVSKSATYGNYTGKILFEIRKK